MTTIEADPTLIPDQGILPSNDVMTINGNPLHVYDIPHPEALNPRVNLERIAVDNPEGFSRLVSGGLDTLQDGETITFTGIIGENTASGVRSISREGENFRITESNVLDMNIEWQHKDFPSLEPAQAVNLSTEEIGDFFASLQVSIPVNSLKDLRSREDELGGVIKAMGYSDNNEVYPLPGVLQSNILRIRQEGGVPIPEIKVIGKDSIPGDMYVGAWAEGKFPVSNRPGWFSHDAAQDHERALITFGDEAMNFAQLYAQAVMAAESIDVEVYPDEYEINKQNPQRVKKTVSGQEKLDQAAIVLDDFTSELDNIANNGKLETDPNSEGFNIPAKHLDVLTQMVSTIMKSPEQAVKFKELLASVNSTALEGEEFSYERYLREIMGRAQQRWGIVPKPPVTQETPQKAARPRL